MTRFVRGVILLVLVAGVAMINFVVMPQRYAMRAKTQILKPAVLPLVVRAVGTLEAKASVALRIPFDAPVLEKKFKEGDRVAAGQLLLTVSREKIRLEFQTKKDALQNAQSELSRARKDLRLQKSLFDKQAVAYSSVEEAQRALVRAEQALRAAQEEFRLQQSRWNSNEVTAPFAGTVVKDYLMDDTQVNSGKDLLMLADVSEYTTKVRVDEMDIKRVSEGQSAAIHIALYPKNSFPAVVSQIGTSMENSGPGVPEIQVTLRLTNTQGLMLRPKLSTEARILTGETESVLSVPREAVDNRSGSPRVWRVDAWQRLRAIPVTLGRSNPERVELTAGVVAGWRICQVADADFVEGLRIVEGDRIAPMSAVAPVEMRTARKVKMVTK